MARRPGGRKARQKVEEKAQEGSGASTAQGTKTDGDVEHRAASETQTDSGKKTSPDVTGDAAVGRALGNAGKKATGAAKGVGHSVLSGFGAMRDVRAASRRLSSAQSELKKLQQGLSEDQAVLAHRLDIERRYPEIVSKQNTEIAEARQLRKSVDQKSASLEKRRTKVSDDLAAMREDHEAKIRPYRNLMDSSRGRSDDAAKSLANVRRALRDAEGQVSSATKRRDQRVSAANQAVDNAKERLNRVQMELDGLRHDESATPGAVSKMEAEVAAEQEHIRAAQQELAAITADAQSSVDTAQQALFAQQKLLKDAEQTAENAKAEAQSHKTEHDSLYREMQAQEKGLEDKIHLYESQLKDLAKQRETADRRIQEARRVIGEADDIHKNPATTQGLRERIANEQGDVKAQEVEVERLTKHSQRLKKETRGARFAFVAVLVVLVILVIVLLYYFVVSPGAAEGVPVANVTNGSATTAGGSVVGQSVS